MTKGLIGKKIGMTQIFDEDGSLIPVTVRSRKSSSCYRYRSRSLRCNTAQDS